MRKQFDSDDGCLVPAWCLLTAVTDVLPLPACVSLNDVDCKIIFQHETITGCNA